MKTCKKNTSFDNNYLEEKLIKSITTWLDNCPSKSTLLFFIQQTKPTIWSALLFQFTQDSPGH